MVIGVPKEIKNEEFRVGVAPSGVIELKKSGHTVLIETDAGSGSGFTDNDYLSADADIVDKEKLFRKSELIIKVKEPLKDEYGFFREGQAIFTYLHLARDRELTDMLLEKKITAFAYETLAEHGSLPLLAPMSAIAGRMAPLVGAFYLQKFQGGTGVLPSGVPGVKPARAVIIGAGVVGSNAARIAFGTGMETVVINRGIEKLKKIDELFTGTVRTVSLSSQTIEEEIQKADVVVGAVLVPGGKTPVLIKREMLRTMKQGAVIVDVSIDQGGCAETSKPTTHANPVYFVDGIIHYAVANMPGAYPRTSTLSLTNATLPYIRRVADEGIEQAIRENASIRSAVNTFRGRVIHQVLAESLGIAPMSTDEIIV